MAAEAVSSVPLRRSDRLTILSGFAGVTAVAWIYLAVEVPRMSMAYAMQSMVQMRQWTIAVFGVTLLMWTVMMVAMMVPTAAPMTLVYAAVARKATKQGAPVAPTIVFVAGYVLMWSLFSIAATAAQASLDRLALLSPAIRSASPSLGGVLLAAAGVYQLTPLKRSCLQHCRAPAHFISQHWRSGAAGALRMGLEHGAYCLGCCWILMGLLFVGGVMNLLWVAAIAAFIMLEKTIPFGETGGRLVGTAMILTGVLTLVL
jgi:predicted metal-binding membrane protein